MVIIFTPRRSFIQRLLSGSTGELPVFTSDVMLTLEPLKTCHPACYMCSVFLFVCFVHITHMFVSIQAQSYVQLFLGISSERHRNCAALQHRQPYLEHVVPPSATYFEGGLLTYLYILYSIHIIYTQISKSNQAFHLSC